jgi:hypothetical protein
LDDDLVELVTDAFHPIFDPEPGLPDGLFSNQKSRFGKNFEGLTWENVDIFYGHSDFLADILDIL